MKGSAIGSLNKYRVMIVCSVLFNIVDALFTYYFIKNNLAVELNPIMNAMIGISCEFFVFVKVLISGLFVILWMEINSRVAKIGATLIFITYTFIIINHLRYFLI